MIKKTILTLSAVLSMANVAAALDNLPQPNVLHEVTGANYVKIAVQEWGNPEGDVILFSHAWSLNHTAWLLQFTSDLADEFRLITYDLRGHGNSEKPMDEAQYASNDHWADDMNAIITQLDLNDVTLVGWSYSSVVVADYIQKYGEDRVKAVNFNGGLSGLNVERIGKYFGTDFDPVTATAGQAEVEALGMVAVTNIMVPANLDKDLFGLLIASTMATPKEVRLWMLNRSVDHEETYRGFGVPVLFSHGTNDNAVLQIAAEEGHSFVPNSTLSLYEGANHGPNWADPARFNAELAELVRNN
jgi:pimeloyl-ACP methyl ester carboxylesterase